MTTWKDVRCPDCGSNIRKYANPYPTVDIIIQVDRRVVLVKRKNPPHGWAIPGGFVDYGESVEHAAVREAYEETGMTVVLEGLLGVYSAPERDRRMHTISTVFVAGAAGTPSAGDDAAEAGLFTLDSIPAPLAFDHSIIMRHYAELLEGGRCLCPVQP